MFYGGFISSRKPSQVKSSPESKQTTGHIPPYLSFAVKISIETDDGESLGPDPPDCPDGRREDS